MAKGSVQATINLKALLDVSGVKGAVGNIQKALSGLTLPKNIGGNIERAMAKIAHEFTSVEQLQAKGFGTIEDANNILKSGDRILKYYNDMAASIRQLGLLSDKELGNLFPKKLTDNIKNAKKALSEYTKEVKANAAAQKKLEDAVKKAQATLTDKKNTLSGKTRVDDAIFRDAQRKIKDVEDELVKKTNDRQKYIESKTWKTPTSWKQSNTVHEFDNEIAAIEGRLQQLRSQLNTQMQATAFDKLQTEIQETENKLQEAKTALNDFLSKSPNTAALNKLFNELQKIDGVDLSNVTRDIQGAEQVIESLSADQINQLRTAFDKLGIELDGLEPSVEQTRDSLREGAEATAEFKQEAQELSQLKSRLMSFFGINNAVNIFQRAIRDAFNTVKELDAAMTETAVVTDYSVGDMWNQLPQYTAAANKLGTTTLGAYQTMTLFYQQGLKTNEAFAIGTETMKMARIANMDYAQATDMMTAALRGFNMELNETSAQRVNDVYSELAAITAADTEEIATAMTKTASIAASANMEFETTAALLSQIIETTREAPETAGTAMKTIIARFTEVKKLFDQGQLTGIDGEGEAININKIDEALKSVGMSLQGFLRGEEGIDDIFLQLAQKWDTLDLSTQRYIATMAAGSRQQSRFLAMMSDYGRTIELVDAANNSAGASQKQFEKTVESLESKLNKLKNAWDEFTMGLANSKLVKGAVDMLTGILNTANKITNVFGGGLLSSILKVGLALNALKFGKILIGASSVQVPKILQSENGQKFSKIFALDQFFDIKNGPEGKEEEAGNTFLASVISAGKKWLNDVITAGNIEKAKAAEEGVIENASATKDAATRAAATMVETKTEIKGASIEEAKEHLNDGKPGLGNLLGGKAGITKLLPKAGLAALIIAVIAAVAGTVYNKSLAGRTKDAERINKVIQESAQATRDSITQMRSLRDAYTESQNKIQEAENFQERNQAISESNKNLLEIIKQKPELMDKVSWGEDGQIKIDTEGLDNAITRLDAVLNGVEFAEGMGQVSLKGLALERTQEQMQILEQDYVNETAIASLSAEREREFELRRAELYNQEQINRLEMQNAVQSAFGNIIPKNISDELASQLLYTTAVNFDATEFSYAAKGQVKGGLNWGGTDWWGRTFGEYGFFGTLADGNIDEQYEELFGSPAPANMSRKDKIDAVAMQKASNAEIEKFSNYVEAVQGNTELQDLVALASGEYTGEIDEINVNSINSEEWEAAKEYLGAKEDESLTEFKQRQADEYDKLRQNTREGLYTSLMSNGFGGDLLGVVNGMAYADQKEMLAVLEKMEGLSPEAIQAAWLNIPDMLANNAEDYQKYFANIDFNNPIRASKQLNDAIESGIPHVQAYAEALKASDESFFGTRSQLSYLLSSEGYAGLNEQISEFIDENGEISADNIEELAESCSELNTLLEEGTMSAEGLATILTGIETGKLAFDQLTDSVINALSNIETLDGFLNKLSDHIENFEPDIDATEGFEFYLDAAEKIAEMQESYEFGNPYYQSYLKDMFGQEGFDAIYNGVWDNPEAINRNISNFMSYMNRWNENMGEGFWKDAAGWSDLVTYQGTDEFGAALYNLDVGKLTPTEVAKQLQEQARAQGYYGSEEFFQSQVANMAAHDANLALQFNENTAARAARDFVTSKRDLGYTGTDFSVVGEKEVQAMATALNIDPELMREKIEAEFASQGLKLPVYTDFIDENGQPLMGDALIQKFTQDLGLSNGLTLPASFEFSTTTIDGKEMLDADAIAAQLAPTFGEVGRIISDNFVLNEAGKSFINVDATIEELMSLGMTLEQAKEWINEFASTNPEIGFASEFQALVNDTQNLGEVKYETQFAFSSDSLDAAQQAATAAAEASVKSVSTDFSSIITDAQSAGEAITKALSDGLTAGVTEAQAVGDTLGSSIETGAATATTAIENVNTALTQTGTTATNASNTIRSTMGNAAATAAARMNSIGNTLSSSARIGSNNAQNSIKSIRGKTVYVNVITRNYGGRAAGGVVQSFASGSANRKIDPGIALTGEEAPEIIWNKEKGYAYIAGKNGPEFNNLRPGDRVFNGEETKQIFKRSKKSLASGGVISAAGGWKPSDSDNSNSGASSNTISDSTGKQNETKWKNEFDWLYNLMEDITELEREQTKIQERYADLLESSNATAAELVKSTEEEFANLYEQQAHQQLALDKRNQEMNEYIAANSKYAPYARYNFEDQTVEIDWDAIEAVQDEELYKGIEEFVSGLEEIQGQIDEADDALIDIENQIEELRDRFEQEYIDFENRVLDALVNERQAEIDALSNINDSIKDTNSKLLDAVQKGINQQRQDRENQRAEDEIAKKERRLAYLRQDTSQDNSLEILSLEEELRSLKEDYTDELIDQKLTKLQEQEDFAAEQRERQIALMESQLTFEQETGQLWAEVQALLNSSVGSDGKLMNDSALAQLLREQENWDGLSEVQKRVWEESLNKAFNQAYAYVLAQEIDEVALKMDAMNSTLNKIANELPNYSQASSKVTVGDSGGGGSGGGGGGGSGDDGTNSGIINQNPSNKTSTNTKTPTKTQTSTNTNQNQTTANHGYKLYTSSGTYLTTVGGFATKAAVLANPSYQSYKNNPGYKVSIFKTGGLADYTGPAWLDGTKSKPELVLNARDTANFIELKDILSNVMRGTSKKTEDKSGDTYIDISIQAEIKDDYDVEKLTKKIKSEIYKDGAYRGVNIIHNIR